MKLNWRVVATVLVSTASTVSTAAFAQDLEERVPGHSGLRPSAGGPSMLAGDTRASDLSVAWEEVDFSIKTALGPFVIKRKFTTSAAWERVGTFSQIFGPNAAYGGSAWFSSLAAYATFNFVPGDSAPDIVIHPQRHIQVRDQEGDLTTSVDFGEIEGDLAPVTSGSKRIKYSGVETLISAGCSNEVSAPNRITAVEPGEGKLVFSYHRHTAQRLATGICRYKAFYRLSAVWGDENTNAPGYTPKPVCEFLYVADQLTSLRFAGGLSLAVSWYGSRITGLSTPTRQVASFTYDGLGRLVSAFADGRANSYIYEILGTPVFHVNTGNSTGTYQLFQKILQGPPLSCVNPGPTWYGPPSTSLDIGTAGAWALSQPVNQSSCLPNATSTATQVQRNGDVLEEEIVTRRDGQSALRGLTTGTSRRCRRNGAPCNDVADAFANWDIAGTAQPADRSSRNMRGAVTVNQVQDVSYPSEDLQEVVNTRLLSQSAGATNSVGADALTHVDLEWADWNTLGTHEDVPATEKVASTIGAGASTRNYVFDPATKRLRSILVEGWTRDATGEPVARVKGTFFMDTSSCGAPTRDPHSRIREIHGPCFVNSTAATDCDFTSPQPIARFSYYPMSGAGENSGRLQSMSLSTSGNPADCSGLVTTYDAYDFEGHVLQQTAPSGAVTRREYSNGLMISEAVDHLRTEYLYRFNQGTRLTGKRSPQGDWDVFCYRVGADSACNGGTLSPELQWTARITGNARDWTWGYVHKTEYTYVPKPGTIVAGGGLLVDEISRRDSSVRRRGLTYDALDRVTSDFPRDGTGQPLFQTRKAYDANDNVIGEAAGFHMAPEVCDGLKLNDPNAVNSTECNRFTYDRLDRISRIDSAGNLATHSFTYDPVGNLRTVTGPRGPLAQYETDDFGNVVTVTGAWATEPTRQVFDARGNLISKSPGITYAYDTLDRPTSARFGATTLWAMGYDGVDSGPCALPASNSIGRLTWKDDSFGRTRYEYMPVGLLIAVRRTRAGATSCGGRDTTYYHDLTGRVIETTYPLGAQVFTDWGTNGHGDEIVALRLDALDGNGVRTVVNNIRYDLGGAVASYSNVPANNVATDVSYYRNGPVALPVSGCTFDPGATDGSGRMTAMTVKRGGLNVLTRFYDWNAEQLSGQASCWMNGKAQNEQFSYDKLGQLTSATRPGTEFAARGGPYGQLGYTYAYGSDRVLEESSGDAWQHAYDANGRETGQLPVVASSWYARRFAFDDRGRMTNVKESEVPLPAGFMGRQLDLRVNQGFESVYSQVRVNGASYQYFYDASGRRRLKLYPSRRSDEYFYEGDRMIEDHGVASTTKATGRVVDQYIWLGNMPVAVLRQRLSESYVRDLKSNDCTRNGEPAECGLFYIINDYLPKPVAMLNSASQLVGVGEYDAFGRVNTVSFRRDAPSLAADELSPRGIYTQTNGATTIGTYAMPARDGLRVRSRVNYALVNTSSKKHRTWVTRGSNCRAKGGSGTYTGRMTAFSTPWFDGEDQYCVQWSADSQGGYGGAVTSSYEYQLQESVVRGPPAWLPLRFSGQYADAETGLFENWHRFYDPMRGGYLAPDPLLLDPAPSSMPAFYGYALSNPIGKSDRTGLAPDSLVRQWALAMSNGQTVVLPVGDARAAVVVAALLAVCGTSEGCQKEVAKVVSQPTPADAINEWLLDTEFGRTMSAELDQILDELNVPMGKGGKGNQKDTGLQPLTDQEVREAYDNAKGEKRKRYEKELKARYDKNKRKDRKTGGVR